MMRTATQCLILLLSLLLARPAAAHFVWVDVIPQSDALRQLRVYFSEGLEPGALRLVDRLKPTEAWVIREGGEPKSVELTSWKDDAGETGALVGEAPVTGDYVAAARCQYGVFEREGKAMLLNYYATQWLGPIEKTFASGKLDLEVVPAMADGGINLTALWQGKPLADAEVVVIDPAGESHDHKTDAAGVVRLSSAAPGVYAIRAKHVEADRGGELDGKQYTQTTHFATTSFKIIAPATTAAAESAEAILAGAREHRAVWDNFPGFVAKIEVKLDEETKEGELHVTADGDVEIKGIGSFGQGLVDRHLNSLVMHRMPGSQFDNGAAFDGSLSHVLGPRVKLSDPQMGSVYRIRDRVVTEVNRAMGKQHFTISVLDVDFNAEGKYMPHAFTVSFWDEKTGDLKLTETVYHEWVRLGKFDLPAQVTVVGCGDKNRRQVLQIVFSDHRLQAGEQAAR